MTIISRHVCESGFATLAIMARIAAASVSHCLGKSVAVQDYYETDGEEAPDTDAQRALCHLH